MSSGNFNIQSNGPMSLLFVDRDITTFNEACEFIKNLPYGRNQNKKDLACVFTEERGTCSTKHAALKQLAIENDADDVRLMMGVFKMSGNTSPAVADTLEKYGLKYIPEAHNYLRIDEVIVDCTKPNFLKTNFPENLLIEFEIKPDQISDFKVNYHQSFLRDWLLKNRYITFTFDELWTIREHCVADLSSDKRESII